MDQSKWEQASLILADARKELALRIVGQETMISGLLMALIAGGHALLEGVPGLAKTLAVKSLAELTGLSFKRIQFTPDLLPADVTGTLIWDQKSLAFSVRRGPVFANIILADEINRAPAKVQSALLEAMEEKQVTIGETTLSLPEPFFVLATQNPIEHEGTYPLPEAELDRFLLKLVLRYPSREEEQRIVLRSGNGPSNEHSFIASDGSVSIKPVLKNDALSLLRDTADEVRLDDALVGYIVALVAASRPVEKTKRGNRDDFYRYISFGASPRASIALYRCSKIQALFNGRDFVLPEDIKAVAPAVLRHRLVLSYEAEADNVDADTLINRILSLVPLP
ncbi:AAA family ATPase [Gracilinema caldarium]|uniref:ATPase associated with various cellular activities AAA_3 n=1 Tax=Gracilinema caldarium (strain ATCC 51460 / DSM 7334 / H1) TaxID=744872 RepID=F8F3X3_GRAC1|nr:MoxR family ATPase [Gracilinema caldarium]AEJ20492.1 ATPase associated with various cellular activities AAA_3 [Gracilinema caldarium DSM 7334]